MTARKFDSRPYPVTDFLEWRDANLLNLSPDFQRRSVWTEKAKSYLIDTIIRQKPVPKLIVAQELQGARSVRVVVDGQQRLRAILGFYDGDFKISRAHSVEFAGKRFDDLPEDVQKDFLKYDLAVDVLFDPAYTELLDIFARINTYTVTLKKQEKLNAAYVGFFKQAAFRLGLRYVEYWLDGSVLTRSSVTRMAEAELAGDLLMALLGGVQTNKNLESFYKQYDDDEGAIPNAEEQFDTVMSWAGTIYPASELGTTNWSRPVLFYTLFTTLGNLLYGLNGLEAVGRGPLKPKQVGKLRVALDEISAEWDQVGTDFERADAPKDLKRFVRMSRRATTDASSRIGRANYLTARLGAVLER